MRTVYFVKKTDTQFHTDVRWNPACALICSVLARGEATHLPENPLCRTAFAVKNFDRVFARGNKMNPEAALGIQLGVSSGLI
jgi:hypothetical protein